MTELVKNDIYTARIEGYSSEGSGVARIGGRAVFVKGALAGEECRIRILKAGKNAVYGKIEELLSPSPERMVPACPVFSACGGCSLQHMTYEEELRFKRRRVDDAFDRIGGLDLRCEDILGAENIWSYRNKAIYSISEKAGRPIAGFFRERTHDVVPAERCYIESDYSAKIVHTVLRWMDEHNIPAFSPETGHGIRRIFCRYGFGTGEGQAVLVTGRGKLPNKEELIASVRSACPETVSIMRNINDRPGDTVLSGKYEAVWGRDSINDTLLGLRFSLSPGAFYQVNRAQAERLYSKALEYASLNKTETALDLYCGVGTITLCLAREAARAIGVEIAENAVKNAGENAEENGIENARFICADASAAAKKLKDEGLNPDVVVVDPPRKGLSAETPAIIASMAPRRVVYVSCDPATLARDLKAFSALGYTPARACAVDMFPRTVHVETVVLLEKHRNAK